jgi:hypothetical protein
MRAFFGRHVHWVRTPGPARDLSIALGLKGVLLLALYLLFFGPAHRVPADAGATASALTGSNLSKESR